MREQDSMDFSLASKKDDPNYEQVRGHVPQDLAMRFRVACTLRKLDYSQGIETALEFWLAHLEENSSEEKPKSDS
jgi:hypothetical protein